MSESILQDLALGFTDPQFTRDALRMTLALAFGAVIGFEREWHAKAAGIRTHMLISLGACLLALLALDIMAGSAPGMDPLRLLQAVATAVGFLAAGTIVVTGGSVKGLTTGTGLWLSGIVGLATGLGEAALAAAATVLAVVVLALLRLLEPGK